MTELEKAARYALETFEYHSVHATPIPKDDDAFAALRQALDHIKQPLEMVEQPAQQETEPEIVERVKRYTGKTMRTARNPNITARECIALANWITANTSSPAQQEPPRVWIDHRIHGWPDCFVMQPDPPHTTPLYTRPAERKLEDKPLAQAREPLTDEQIKQIANNCYSPYQSAVISFARAIEAAHGIK